MFRIISFIFTEIDSFQITKWLKYKSINNNTYWYSVNSTVTWVQLKNQCVWNDALSEQCLLNCLKLCIYVTQYYIRAVAQKRLIHKPMLTQKVLSIKRGEVLVCACQLPALRWIQLFTKGHTTSLLKACHCVSSYPRGQRYYNQQLKNRWWFWLNVACADFPLRWAEFYSNLQTRLNVLISMCGLAL